MLALPLTADRADDILASLNYVATALADENPDDAMARFDKSFVNYSKLRDYFAALTISSQVVSEIDIADEQDSGSESKATVEWTLSLTNKTTLETERRTGEIQVRLVSEKGKWKIVDFSPIELFNPRAGKKPK
ncbi:MAG: hypothetical protein JOY62_17320 [Acidobacteriaceae bacterium]|nr:hypothetical protein [Acidobacteriaceae bacterium]MBV9781726.1 hypothetical protein [Acidobacteriaceae bacterium]